MSIRIDNEFKSLIPPLSDEEYRQLEENCLKEGIRDSLVVWDNDGEFVLIDGHNRYKIAQKHNLPYNHRRMEFPDRDAVKLWIIDNQLGKRNLIPYDKVVLEDKKRNILAEQAKGKLGGDHKSEDFRKSRDKKSCPLIPSRQEKRENSTDYKIAKAAGTSEDTVRKVRAINNSGDQKLIDDVRSGNTTINRAYQTVKGIDPIKPKTMAQMKKENLDQAKEEHENFQSQKVVGVSDIAKDKENRKKIAEELRLSLLGLGKPIENFFTRMTEGEVDMKAFRKELSDKEADQIVEMIAVWRHDLYLISQEVIGD